MPDSTCHRKARHQLWREFPTTTRGCQATSIHLARTIHTKTPIHTTVTHTNRLYRPIATNILICHLSRSSILQCYASITWVITRNKPVWCSVRTIYIQMDILSREISITIHREYTYKFKPIFTSRAVIGLK